MEKAAPATTKDLRQAQASLLEYLRRLAEALDSGSGTTPLKAGAQLAAMYTRISDHFGFEEQYGWTAAVLKQEPRLEHAAAHLIKEHRELVPSLDTLIEEAKAAQSLDDAFREKVRHWIQGVLEHESRKNDFLEDAFIEDLGAGDEALRLDVLGFRQ